MRATIMFGCLATIALAPAAHGRRASPTIPAAFRGEWDESLNDCATRSGDGHVSIAARHIRFYAGDADVISRADSTMRSVTLGLAYSNEGEIVRQVDKLALSPAGDVLTITSGDGVFTKRRCPVEKKN